MDQKLPYYMAYPMPLAYDDEKIERLDFEYMKSLYPATAKKILPYVEEECDRMEYQNSMMYDEYPDRLQLRLMCNRIYDNVQKQERIFYGNDYMEIQNRPSHGRPSHGQDWLRDLIEVMLFQELYKRRCDNRRCRRRFY